MDFNEIDEPLQTVTIVSSREFGYIDHVFSNLGINSSVAFASSSQ
jgi:hypothetical protein